MPGSSDYNVLLKATIDLSRIKAQISELQEKSNLKFNANGAKDLSAQTTKVASSLKESNGWLVDNARKVAQWAISTSLVYGSLQEIRKAYEYISDLNKELTNIGMVTGQSTNQLSSMANQFNAMGKELGATTLEMAQGATEFIRQGKTAAETTEFLRVSTMMSKLGNLEAKDATDKLIAVTNAYNISAKDSINVVNTLISLDNKFATSTSEIAAAMQKSSSMAKLAGVSYQDLASYVTVISATTRQSGETIGQALKTVFARMEQVKAGASIDEEGEAINNVEKVLLKQGIRLRDNNEQFRDMSDVLQDVAVKYKELGAEGKTVEQQQIIGAIAGVRQANMLSALFDKWDQVGKAQEAAAQSGGMATERYKIYMEGIEATTNRFTAAWEEMWMKTISSDFIKDILNAATAVTELVTKMGGLIPVLEAIGILLVFIKGQSIYAAITTLIATLPALFTGLNATTVSLGSLSIAEQVATTSALGLSMAMGAVATAILAVVQAWQTYQTEVVDRQKQGQSDISNTFAGKISGATGTQDVVDKSVEALKTLNDAIDSTGGMGDVFGQKQKIMKDALSQTSNALVKTTRSYSEYKRAIQEVNDKFVGIGNDKSVKGIEAITEAQYNSTKATEAATDEVDSWVKIWEDAHKVMSESADIVDHTAEELDKITSAANSVESSVVSSFKAAQSALEEYDKTGEFTLAQANALIDAGYGQAISIDSVTGAVSVNIPMLQQLALAQINSAIEAKNHALSQLSLAEATGIAGQQILSEISVLNAQKKALSGQFVDVKTLISALGNYTGATKYAASATNELNKAKKEAYQAEIKGYEAQKKALDNQKKDLEKQKDAYKDIIDAMKEKLRIQKETDDYNSELEGKNKELADIDKELLELQFDNSEEAKAKRLQLEADKAEKIEEITQFQADRTYDIQMDALDAEYEAYAKMIDQQLAGIDSVIAGFDSMIAKINEMIDALSRLASAGGGSGGSSTSSPTTQHGKRWISTGHIPETHIVLPNGQIQTSGGKDSGYWQYYHQGGLVESHHDGDFAGNLKSNEVFSKLLKGEYVSTEAQMKNFLSDILPKMMIGSSGMIQNKSGGGDISISMPITIEGNADESLLPKIKNMVSEVIYEGMKNKGYRRNVNSYGNV